MLRYKSTANILEVLKHLKFKECYLSLSALNRSTKILAKLKEICPKLDFYAVDYVFFVELRTKLASNHFKAGLEDVSYTLDHDRRTVRLNAINPYEILAEVDDFFKTANDSYIKLAEEVLLEILKITGYERISGHT